MSEVCRLAVHQVIRFELAKTKEHRTDLERVFFFFKSENAGRATRPLAVPHTLHEAAQLA